MQTYLVNLDRSTDRLAIMTDRLATIGLTWERVPAVDGHKLTDDQKKFINTPNWKFPTTLTPGEIGCMMSHRRCWEKFLASKDNWLLVIEDDCVFSSQSHRYLSNPDWIPSDIDLVQFSTVDEPAYSDQEIALPDLDNSLYRITASSPKGTYGYFISRRAATLALETSILIEEPADNFMFGHYSDFAKRVPFYRLAKGIIKVIDDVPTTIPEKGGHKEWNIHRLSLRRLMSKIKLNNARKNCRMIQQQWLT